MEEKNEKISLNPNAEILGKKYTCNFKMNYNKEQDDAICLQITISDSVAKLIEDFCVKDMEPVKVNFGNDNTLNNISRYKIKSWIMNSLSATYNSTDRDMIFSVPLITDKKIDVMFANVNTAFDFVSNFRRRLNEALTLILKYKNFNVDVNYSVNGENNNDNNK